MKVAKRCVFCSVVAGILMTLASAAGVFSRSTYSREAAAWATQGIGQDLVSLFLVAPVLFVSAYFVSKNSLRATLVWLGTLSYLIYSYVIYAFFVHFGPWFLPYVAILGLAFYSVVGTLTNLDWRALSPRFNYASSKPASIFLMVVAIAFYLLWLRDTIGALLNHTLPQGVAENGVIVNPVHVLDMAFLLPGMIAGSVSLWRRNTFGFFSAVPFLVFCVLMGSAIVSMMVRLGATGNPAPIAMEAAMVVVILAALGLTVNFLRQIRNT